MPLDNTPSGATAVVVFAATEESEGSIEEVWEELKTSPARLHTIDTGGMETIVSTGAGRDLFNMAWFGRGKHFAPATAAELAAACTALAGDCLAAPRFCSDCGARLVPGAKFCTKCGTKVRGL